MAYVTGIYNDIRYPEDGVEVMPTSIDVEQSAKELGITFYGEGVSASN